MLISEAINSFGDKKIGDIAKTLSANNKVATGKLNSSLRYVVESNPENFHYIINFFAQSYLLNVAYGRKPGTYPNITNLKQWCIARGIPVEKVYNIAKKIFNEGIAPDSSLNDALAMDKLLLDFRGILNESAVTELQTQLDNIIKEFSKYN